jgi:hypothetical protein
LGNLLPLIVIHLIAAQELESRVSPDPLVHGLVLGTLEKEISAGRLGPDADKGGEAGPMRGNARREAFIDEEPLVRSDVHDGHAPLETPGRFSAKPVMEL